MSRKIRWDESVKENTLCLVEALLSHADNSGDEESKTELEVRWVKDNKLQVTGFEQKSKIGKRTREVEVGTKREHLLNLLKEAGKSLKLPGRQNKASTNLEDRELDEIQTALQCLKDLGVREDEISAKNLGYWKFSLTLVHQTKREENIKLVEQKWEEHEKTKILKTREPEQLRTSIPPDIEIVDVCVIDEPDEIQKFWLTWLNTKILQNWLKGIEEQGKELSYFPLIDIKLRNTSTRSAFLKEITVNATLVKANGWGVCFHMIPPTCAYHILLEKTEDENDEENRVKISQLIKPNDVDRFVVIIGSREQLEYAEYTTNLTLHYNKDSCINLGNFPVRMHTPYVFEGGKINEIIELPRNKLLKKNQKRILIQRMSIVMSKTGTIILLKLRLRNLLFR